MVINTDPCYAYLLHANRIPRPEAGDRPRLRALRLLQEQRLVRPHQPQDARRDGQPRAPASTATATATGPRTVEVFIDACLSLEDLIDLHCAAHQRRLRRRRTTSSSMPKTEKTHVRPAVPLQGLHGLVHQSARGHRAARREERQQKQQEKEDNRSFPERADARRAVIPAWSTPRSKTGSATCWPSFATKPITSPRRARPRS